MSKRVIDKIYDISGFLIKTYSKKLAKNPQSRFFVPLSDIYRRDGMLKKALDVSKKGVNIFPNYVSGRIMLGMAYFELEKFKEAEDEFKKAESLSRDNLLAHKMLYKIYNKTGDAKAAIGELKKVIAVYPEDRETKTLLGSIEDKTRGKEKSAEEGQGPAGVDEKNRYFDNNSKEKGYINVEERKNAIIAKMEMPEKESPARPESIFIPEKAERAINIFEKWLENIKRSQESRS